MTQTARETVWQGEVRVYAIEGNPTSSHCYAWGYEQDGKLKVHAVLHAPPIDSPVATVRAAIAADFRRAGG